MKKTSNLARILLILAAGMLLLASCATNTGYYDTLNMLVSNERYPEAASLAETSTKEYDPKTDSLLYYLDCGILKHYSGNYQDSNQYFEKAKTLATDYFTKSITAEASTLLVNDTMRPYYGENFERSLINVFCALNYISMGNENEALVEARQVDHFLTTLKTNYGYKDVYTEDAFARYLMGMLYENQGEINDAYISYKQALVAYRKYESQYQTLTPADLLTDVVRTGKKLGFNSDLSELQKSHSLNLDAKPYGNEGEVVFICYNGFAPEKIDNFFEIAFTDGWLCVEAAQVQGKDESEVAQARTIARSIVSDEQIRLSFPKYVDLDYRIKNIAVSFEGNPAVSGYLSEDVGAIAKKGLQNRIGRIRTRTYARATLKYVLRRNISQKVQESNSELVGWLAKTTMKAVANATEVADKRCWRSLPDKIIVTRTVLPVGKQTVNLAFKDEQGNTVTTKEYKDIEIRKGKKTFITVRTAL